MRKKYLVSGGRNIHGHAPGTEFEAELKPSQEARLLKNGFIELVEDEEPETVADPDERELSIQDDDYDPDPQTPDTKEGSD